jgi:hypothetical protein
MIRILDSEFSKQLPLIHLVNVICRRGKALGNKPSHYMAEDLQPKVQLKWLWNSFTAAPFALHIVHSQFPLQRPMRWFSCCLGEIVENLAKRFKIQFGKSAYFCEGCISLIAFITATFL